VPLHIYIHSLYPHSCVCVRAAAAVTAFVVLDVADTGVLAQMTPGVTSNGMALLSPATWWRYAEWLLVTPPLLMVVLDVYAGVEQRYARLQHGVDEMHSSGVASTVTSLVQVRGSGVFAVVPRLPWSPACRCAVRTMVRLMTCARCATRDD
jgi:hypothetical protein